MRKPRPFRLRESLHVLADCETNTGGDRFVFINTPALLRPMDVSRLRAWLEKAEAWCREGK